MERTLDVSTTKPPLTPTSSSPPITLGHRVTYLGFLGFELCLRLLPMIFWCYLGEFIGLLGWLIMPRYRRRILRNLRIIFRKELSTRELHMLTRKNFQTTICNFVSAAKAATMSDRALEKHYRIKGAENVYNAIDKGKGLACAISHAGNWELLARIRPSFATVSRFGSMYRELDNPLIETLWQKRRQSSGCEMLGKKANTFADATQILRDNGMLGILCDQNAGNYGIIVPYYKKLTSTTNLPALLQRRTGATLITVNVKTLRRGFWEVEFSTPLELPLKNKDTADTTARINKSLSILGKQSPLDGFWLHNRWKQDVILPRGEPIPKVALITSKTNSPLRILLSTPKAFDKAIITVPLLRSFILARPDTEWTIICPSEQKSFWELQPEVRLVIDKSKDLKNALLSTNNDPETALDIALFLDEDNTVLKHIPALGDITLGCLPSHPYKSKIRRFPHPLLSSKPKHYFTEIALLAKQFLIPITAECFTPQKTSPIEQQPLVLLAPFSSLGNKAEAPLSLWEELVAQLDIPCAFIAQERDRERLAPLAEKLSLPYYACGDKELLTQLSVATALIAVDGVLPALAAHTGLPCTTLFGPRMPEQHRPLGTFHTQVSTHNDCCPCLYETCPRQIPCLHNLRAEQVLRAYQQLKQ